MPRGGRREGAGKKNSWTSKRETKLIRVPEYLADRLLDIARYLDAGGEIQFLEEDKLPF